MVYILKVVIPFPPFIRTSGYDQKRHVSGEFRMRDVMFVRWLRSIPNVRKHRHFTSCTVHVEQF